MYSVNQALDGSHNGQEIIVYGEMLLGLEAGVIYPSGTPRSQMGSTDSIHIEFDGWLEGELKHLPVQGNAVVKGHLEYDNIKHYGHMGINKYRLFSPTVIKWPSPLSEIVFFGKYIFLPLLCLMIVVFVARKMSKKGAGSEGFGGRKA